MIHSSNPLWGAQFDAKQQYIVGWLLFSVTAYLYFHFIAIASIEIAKWIEPFYEGVVTKNRLLKHPAFDEIDWMDWLSSNDEQDKEVIAREVRK